MDAAIHSTFFSSSYVEAREKFCTAAQMASFQLETHAITPLGPQGEQLTIDVAIGGASQPKSAVILSSGLHGVEGFCGSAIQLAVLTKLLQNLRLPQDVGLILVHSLNPYGFAWRRRCNEDNIDLNRNFLLPDETYQGSAPAYRDLDCFLNPTLPPTRFEPFLLKAFALVLRHGMRTIKNALPVGQYDFPRGLFFGGHGPSQTQTILASNMPHWIGKTARIIHLDFHTGLGQWSTYKLLVDATTDAKQHGWLQHIFGADAVEILGNQGIAYQCRGDLGPWCLRMFPCQQYTFAAVEFGTYSMLSVLKALRAENQAYWWDRPGSSTYYWAKNQLEEVFNPANMNWQDNIISQGIGLVQKILNDLSA